MGKKKMASLLTPSDCVLNKESSTPKTRKEGKEKDSTPMVRRDEEVTGTTTTTTSEKRSEPGGLNLVSNWEDKNRTFSFDELAERGFEALKRRNFTEAVNSFEIALRIRMSEEAKLGPESVKTMLKNTDAWFLKGREIFQSSKTSPAAVAELVPYLRAKLKNMTQIIATEILQNIPDDSEEKYQILLILAEAGNKTDVEQTFHLHFSFLSV